MTYLVADTETTGLVRKADLNSACSLYDNGDEIVQIGGLLLNADMVPVRAFCHYCDCLLPESVSQAYNKHGIRMSSVRQYVPNIFFEEVALKLIPELFSDNLIVIGYNTDFDVKMIAQSLRNFSADFDNLRKVTARVPKSGRWQLDVMKYLPTKAKLVSYYSRLSHARDSFFNKYAGNLVLETNAPELLERTWQSAHNSLFDAIETYLLFITEVWNKKIFPGR